MMLSNAKRTMLAAVALLLVMSEAAKAQPGPGPVDMITVTNRSSVTINYAIAGPGGPWLPQTLPPGGALSHYIAPGTPLFVSFDQGGGAGVRSVQVQTWFVPDRISRGKPHAFVVDRSGFVQLIAE